MDLEKIINWLNGNEGFLSLILFIVTIIFGWASGIFKSFTKRPRFKIRIIEKMTFGTVFLTGEQYTPPGQGTYDLHKTAFVLYLEITNTGTADSKIGKIHVGYYPDTTKPKWRQKRNWIVESTIISNFALPIANSEKMLAMPHLKQKNGPDYSSLDTFLKVGDSVNGVSYHEQTRGWGNFYPRIAENGTVELIVKIKDAFGYTYKKKVYVPLINISDALDKNPDFGMTEYLLNPPLYDSWMQTLEILKKMDNSIGDKKPVSNK